MKNTFARATALGLAVVMATSMALMSGSTATAGSSTTGSRAVVAQSPQGQMASHIVGTTKNGRDVTGKFVPLKFSKRNGHVRARGLLSGVVHNANGTTKTFSVLRTMRVRSINGTPATARTARTALSARATCPVLHLVLGPLDLDLLGLQIHLDRVVLNIDAQSGPGNLLGNLVCAVAGLLDGGLQGLLGRLVTLLNQILGQLGLGL
ncbi:MAG TPA: hypothetical protein VFI99_13055 [Nocardioides sp.]|jgi:hypothetical protein|nr:hypothetical protein [Nocardioides sp.]